MLKKLIITINSNKMEIEEFLTKIKSTSKSNKYKPQSLSPLRYTGGKSKAIGLILENMPNLKEKKIVSPFFGGGSFEIVLSQQLGFEVIGYDIFEMLVNFWQQIINNPHELGTELRKLIPTKQQYYRNRTILLNYWDKIKPKNLIYKTRNPIPLNEIEQNLLDNDLLKQASYFYYNMQLSYGPMFLGWCSSIYLDNKKYQKIIEKIENFKSKNLSVFCESFETSIPKHKNDFLFLDPPYYIGGGDSKMFKGMYPNCNFPIHHNGFNHQLLQQLLHDHKGGFFLTYNDCSTIRDLYKEYKQVYPKWNYTYGQGETRIGKNRLENTGDNIKKSHEIFIICPSK